MDRDDPAYREWATQFPIVICGRCDVEMTILRPTGTRCCPKCGGFAAETPKDKAPQP